jgi:hypothetical protein
MELCAVSSLAVIDWLKELELPSGGILSWEGSGAGPYPECTGYLIPTLLAHDEYPFALRCADWLVSIQDAQGFWRGIDGAARTFDTAAIVEGLRVIGGYSGNVTRGVEWMRSMCKDGQMLVSPAQGTERRCYTMRAAAIAGYSAPAAYWKRELENLTGERSHYVAYCLEGLWNVGEYKFVTDFLERTPRGVMPYTMDGGGEDYCATAQFALLRAWAGLDYLPELSALRARVSPNGSILLSDTVKIRPIWAAKYYLDLEACAQEKPAPRRAGCARAICFPKSTGWQSPSRRWTTNE